jgi:hypothetical protein
MQKVLGSAKHTLIFVFIVIIFLANSIPYLLSQSVNADEGAYSTYAIRYLKGDPTRVEPRRDNSMMPVIAWNLVPRVVQQVLHPGLSKGDEGRSDIINGRFMSLVIGIWIMWVLYIFGSELFDRRTGLIAAFFFSICPNSLANASFASTDIYAVLVVLLTVFLYWRWRQHSKTSYFILLAIVVALGQVTKQSMTYLYLLLPIMVWVTGDYKRLQWRQAIKGIFVFLIIQWLLINAVYYFYLSFMPLGEYSFLSGTFKGLQNILPSGLWVPFPEPYITGLDQAVYYNQLGGGIEGESCFGKVTILGKAFTGEGIWYYYLVTLFFKTPIPLLLFIVAAIASRQRTVPHKTFLLLPVLFFLLVMSLMYHVQAGVRHIIFIYPFLFLLSAAWVVKMLDTRWRWVVYVGLAWWAISVGRYWGQFYPYTNELILDKKNAWQWVGHGNLDIHQGYLAANKFLQAHQDIQMLPDRPGKGKFLVSVNDYLDIWNTGAFDWIRKNPVSGEVAFTWLIIEVP